MYTPQETNFILKIYKQVESERMEKIYHANNKHHKAEVDLWYQKKWKQTNRNKRYFHKDKSQ